MTVSLPRALRTFASERVESGGFGSTSDYIRDLIRRDQREIERRPAAAGADLAKTEPIPAAAWRELRASLARGDESRASTRVAEALELL
jgi:antitoxin ParD1/3/4